MKKILSYTLTIIALLFACDAALGPTHPTEPPPLPRPVEPPPRVDQPFSWDTYQGYVAFGLGHPGQSDADILTMVNGMWVYGWNTPWLCSETEFWEGPGYPTKPRDPERLRHVLDLLARVPGIQVVVIGNCTLKRQIPLNEQIRNNLTPAQAQRIEQEAVRWSETVANIAKDFPNVAISTHNEFYNCRGRDDWGGRPENCAGKEDVKQHIRIYRDAGVQFVTADDSIGPRVPGDSEAKTFTFRLANIGAWPPSFHPAREHRGQPWDPDLTYLGKLARYNGTFVLSETVAWMDYSGHCDGLRTCDPLRIDTIIGNCAAVPECRMTFHCENCLAGMLPTRIPQAR